MLDLDPRDFDPRDRDDDRRPDLGRGGHTPDNARVPEGATRDPRDIAIRHVDLPRGPRREPVRGRDRDYEINGNQSRVLATVGAFRVVSSRDLETSFGRAGNPRSSDLRHLRETGLVQTAPLPGHRDRVVTLTQQGRELLEARRRPGENGSQAFYAGVRKPRELEHDVQVYRAYVEAADRLTERGGRLRRVVLDYELKREDQRFLQERNRGRADSDGRPDRDAQEIALWAVEHNLPYFDEQVHFPDVRIEYEDIDGCSREEDARSGETASSRLFPDALPIGVEAPNRALFIYPATRSSLVDSRPFLRRHRGLLSALPAWTLRLVFAPDERLVVAAWQAVVGRLSRRMRVLGRRSDLDSPGAHGRVLRRSATITHRHLI